MIINGWLGFFNLLETYIGNLLHSFLYSCFFHQLPLGHDYQWLVRLFQSSRNLHWQPLTPFFVQLFFPSVAAWS